MAFTALPSIRSSISWPSVVVSNMSDNMREGFYSSRNKGIYKSQRTLQDLTVANVASPLPVTAPPPPQSPEEGARSKGGRRHHGAWTSIPQERWEGELDVQGEIPLWLVSGIFIIDSEFYTQVIYLIVVYLILIVNSINK